ncbi:MAG: hypothetical protein U9P44_02110 [archaeon]|nr:hypothetical protein [archaeon]
MGLEVLIGNLNTFGFYDFFFPFLLFVAIFFGLLQKYKVFGESDTKALDGIISICISFFIINYTAIGLYFSTLFAIGASIIGAMLVGVIILGMVGIDVGKKLGSDKNNTVALPIIAAVGLVIVSLFLYASGLYDDYLKGYAPTINDDTLITLVGIVFVMVVFYIITKNSK